MRKDLQTQNISLDTSFIEGQNFLAGTKVADLSTLCLAGHIKLFLTDITYREVKARFRKNIIQVAEKVKKPKENIESCVRILRNFQDHKIFFELPIIDTDSLCQRFSIDFDKWIKDHSVTIIATGHLTVSSVFDDYFDNRAPFSEGQKKHEFPDAFTLKALSDFFSNPKSKTYLLTTDNDLLTFKSKTLIPVDDAATLLDLVIRNTPEKLIERAIKLIDEEFKVSKERLQHETKEMILRAIEDEVGSQGYIGDLEIDCLENIDLMDIEFEKFSIVHLDMDNKSAKLECETVLSFDVSVAVKDYSEAWHDKEENRWHFVDSRTCNVDDTFDLAVRLLANFDLSEETVEIEVDDINNGQKLDIFSNFKQYR